jgi:hypothetical protein
MMACQQEVYPPFARFPTFPSPVPHLSLSSAAMSGPTANSPITQVSQHQAPQIGLQPQLLTRLNLDLRGRRFSVDRETIMNLPESVLLCLFPNGLVLSRPSMALSDGGDGEDEDDQVYGVDVRVVSLQSLWHAHVELAFPCSLTLTASILSSLFSDKPQTHFMALKWRQDC